MRSLNYSPYWQKNDHSVLIIHYTKAISNNTGWTCGSLAVRITGDAVWKTPWHPSIAESKDPSSSKSALKNWSLSLAPSSESKCSVFFGSSVEYICINSNWKAKLLVARTAWKIKVRKKNVKLKALRACYGEFQNSALNRHLCLGWGISTKVHDKRAWAGNWSVVCFENVLFSYVTELKCVCCWWVEQYSLNDICMCFWKDLS